MPIFRFAVALIALAFTTAFQMTRAWGGDAGVLVSDSVSTSLPQESLPSAQANEDVRSERVVDAEQAQALEAAKAARADAERLLKHEFTRLSMLEDQARAVQRSLQEVHSELLLRRDLALGWQRRVRDAKAADTIAADATYDGLLRQLRASRDELVAALDTLKRPSGVPPIGADVLIDVPSDIQTDAVRQQRIATERAITAVRADEQQSRDERSSILLDEITALNRERLGLLPYLTAQKRNAATGFTAAGWEQALAEGEHLVLSLRFHQHVARGWWNTLRRVGADAISPWRVAVTVVPLIGAFLAFLWARRKTYALLRLVEVRVAEGEQLQHRTSPSTARHFVGVLIKIHRPLEWMVFFAVFVELVPTGARELVEVQLLSSVITWFLVGALVVNTINALAAGREGVLVPLKEDEQGLLRLRSLRLVGGTVVVFGLTLVLTARVVGEGTIYSWVSSVAWFSAIPVFLVLVRWWRGTVFHRLDRVRKKTAVQAWILDNRLGWKSFLAAMVGALQLFSVGTLRIGRSWVTGFDLARRIHAYLFKREIERLGEGLEQLAALPEQTLAQFHPERPFTQWIACPADDILRAISSRCSSPRGGVVAVYAARGMGKSSLLRAIAEQVGEGVVIVNCTHQTSLADIRAAIETTSDSANGQGRSPRVVLLDDAQALIQPCIGGLYQFDEVLASVRADWDKVTWVVAMDASLWPLLQRARDARPIFDECHRLAPWAETQIGALLSQRCNQANVAPTYADLLDKLPPGTDEIERQEALASKRAGYQRMLWDHVGGNPGLALEAWRASLAQDSAGVVRVRSLQVPDSATLEKLADESLFVLRAVLQLAPTTIDVVASATRLRPEEVLIDFRFGKSQGFFEEHEGRVRVAWPWLCAVTSLLERRHLLVVS